MSSSECLPLLRKAGLVLLFVGLLDVGLMVYAIASRVSYSSSLNIFAVIAGVFLLRGSLRAASVVRWLALFFVGASASMFVIAPVLFPVSLLLTQIQVNPLSFIGSVAMFVVALMVFAWLIAVLGAAPIRAARAEAGKTMQRARVPVALGVGFAVVLAVISFTVQHSESAARALNEARALHGEEYEYHVASINYSSTSEGTYVSGVVTAWKSGSIKELPFKWRE